MRCIYIEKVCSWEVPMRMDPTESSETSAIKVIWTPGTYPKDNKLQLEHGENLKLRTILLTFLREVIGSYCANNTIYLITAVGLKPGGSSTVHIYTQTIYRTEQLEYIIYKIK